MALLRTPRRTLLGGFVLLALFSARPAAVRADASVFGPVTCQRGSGAATRFEYAFKTAEPSRGFVLKVYNGGLEDTTFELVSSSTVTLNGNQVLGPSAFNQNVAYTEVPVALLSDNTLAVEVRGKPGGAMIVKIHPLVVIDAPAQGQAMRSEPIVVSGRLHAAADTASVNGVPAVISGDRFTASGVPLIPGDNSLMATARHAGGFAGSDSVNVVLDSVPPGIAALAPPHDTATADAHVAVTAGFGDDLSGIDVAGCRLALDGADVTARAEFTVEGTSYRPAVVWSDGEHRAELIVRDRAGNAATANWSFTVDTIPPAITVTSPPEGATVTAPTIDLAGRVDDPTARVSVNGVGAPLVGGAFEVPGIPLAIGENMIIVEAVDRLGNRSVHALHVLYAPPAPTVSVRATPDSILRGESAALSWTSTDAATASIDQGIGAVAASGSLSVEPTATTTYRITAEGPGGTATATASISVTEPGARATLHAVPERISAGQASVLSWSVTGAAQVVIEPGIGAVSAAGSLTVRPSGSTTYRLSAIGAMGVTTASVRVTVEGAVAAFSAGSFGKQYQSLVPPDATIPAYAEGQLSLVSGTVTDSAGTPISGVSVTVHGRPELGTASTDGAGTYVLPVEGGTAVTLALSKPGFLRIHRSVEVGWNDFVQAEAAVMIPEDALATKIELDGNPGSAFVHRSSVTLDASGPRAASVIIPGDTGVFAVTEAGEVPLTSFELRATEYAVPEAMPARLPPASAYTYCVDISASGLENVRFSKPVAFLVENFLGFPVGEAVPVGYYDFRQARWVPSENGRVVALLDTDGDGATDALDASGDGLPDDLNANGSVADEAFGLDDAARFPPGATFWRTMIAHLSPWDCNWPWGFPGDATPPNPLGSPFADQKREKDPVQCTNSYVERLGRVYHEDLPVPGTDLTLHYASDRVPGYRTIVYVPASGQSVPASLRSIVVKLEIAGRELVTELPPAPRQIATFAWDGRDALGRPVSGLWKARARIGFVYGLVMYGALQAFERSFGAVGSSYGLGPGRTVGISWKEIEFEVDRPAQLGDIADGWTISAHHQFLPSEPTRMYRGDGSTLVQETRSLATLAGTYGWDANGGTYVCSALCYPRGMGVDRAGNLYVGDLRHHRVVKVSPAGTISAFAGQVDWTGGFGGDGGPAISARFKYPGAIAVDPEGNVFIVDLLNARVRKVDSRGVITTVAGNGSVGFSPDNTPAVEASLGIASGTGNEIAVDRWGNLYIAEARNHRVRKVGPDGLLTTVAGNGVQGYGGNGRALGTNLDGPCAVATDAAGNLYISENATSNGNRYGIKRVTPDGRIARIAGGGTATGTEGVPALQASLDWVTSLLADQVGDLYFIDRTRGVCKVDAGGVLSAVSGGWRPGGLAMDASGALYVLGSSTHIVQKIRTPATDQTLGAAGDHLITDEGLGHVFSPSGLHLATVDLETRATLVTFGYREGRLSSVTDRHGNVTEIVRDAAGNAAAIVAPGGQRTELTVRGGMLETVSYPDGGLYEMAYAGGGLMVEQWDPNGNRFSHSFDDPGRLQRLRDPEGGDWMWDRAVDVSGRLTTTIASAEGDVTSYEEAATWSGVTTTQAISPDGSQSTTSRSANGLTETVEAGCGTNVTMSYSLDPVWLYRYPYAVTESTPSGRTRRRSVSRSHRDTNGDKKVDAVTESYVLNGRTATRVNSSLTGEMTLTSAGGRATAMMYDPGLLLVSEVGVPGLSPLKYRYDVAGRITDIDVGQRSTRLHYDGAGNLDSIVDADGRTSTYAHDAMGRLISEMRPGGVSLAYQYDPNGNLTVLTNPNAVSSSFDYTANNQRAALIPPLSGSYQYRYGRDRRLTAVLLPSGRTISSVYAAGTLEATVTPEGRIDYDHLCGGRLSRAARGGEIVQLSYDGPLMTADARSGTLAGTVGYAYNSDFAVSSVTYAGATVNLGYDADGLLTQAGVYAIARDARNGLPLGVSGGGLVLERTFNGYGELDAQSWTVAGGAAYDWAVTRDLAGRIVSRSESVAGATVGWSYRYDSAGRLVEVERDGAPVEQYTYDPNGNRLSEMNALRGLAARAYTHSVEDHTLTAGSDSFVFDVDGFLRSSTTARGTATFEYSSRGELLRAVLPDETIVTYVHDPFGRRIVKQVDGVTVEKYLWADRTTLLAVYDGSDNLVQRYAYADGRVPVSMTAGGATHFLLTDQVGSLRAVADSSGAIVKRVDYDSFGNIIADTNPAFAVPFGFAGGLHDRDTGLVRFGFRDYAPELGRFTAKDPIDFAGGDTNLYAYAMSDPINLIDRLGLWNWDVHSGTDRSDYGTYTWARDLGISSVIASSIALANNAADEYGNWAPVVGNPGRHFDTAAGGVDSRMLFANLDLALAARQYKAGKPCQAYQTLGRGLHSVQDIPAHMGWTPLVPHPAWYDNVLRRPDALRATEIATKAYLLQFLQGIGQ